MIIGSIIVLLLLVGGITLYKTFALYEEKKEFNVLKGRVPHFGKYKESILNGADPVLGENLIPVEIDDTGKVTKANIESKWYSYAEKKWANAVILTGEDTYQEGDIIPESTIESYFVWIPKYSYKIQTLGVSNKGQEKAFEIEFGITNTNDAKEGECTTPGWNEETKDYNGNNVSGVTGNCKAGDYMTHPAFISMGTNGLWVGKFETGYKEATSIDDAQVNEIDPTQVQIKPNVYTWRNIQVSNAFYSSYNYMRELDSHMMKNTEWGGSSLLTI